MPHLLAEKSRFFTSRCDSDSFRCILFLYQAIAPYIPTNTVKLSSVIYEMILYDFLKKDYKVTVSHCERFFENLSICTLDNDFLIAL